MMSNGDISDEDNEEQYLNDPIVAEESASVLSQQPSQLDDPNTLKLLRFFTSLLIVDLLLQILFLIIFFASINVQGMLMFGLPNILLLIVRGIIGYYSMSSNLNSKNYRLWLIMACTMCALNSLQGINQLIGSITPNQSMKGISLLFVLNWLIEMMLFGISYYLCTATSIAWNRQEEGSISVKDSRNRLVILLFIHSISLLIFMFLIVQVQQIHFFILVVVSVVMLFSLFIVIFYGHMISLVVNVATAAYSLIVLGSMLLLLLYCLIVKSPETIGVITIQWNLIAILCVIVLRIIPDMASLVMMWRLFHASSNGSTQLYTLVI